MAIKTAKFSSALRKYRLSSGRDEWYIESDHGELFNFIWRNVVNKKGRVGASRYYMAWEIDGNARPRFLKVPKKAISDQGARFAWDKDKISKLRAYMK